MPSLVATTSALLLASAAMVAASPAAPLFTPAPLNGGPEANAAGGQYHAPAKAAAADAAADPPSPSSSYLTITLVNSESFTISTAYAGDANSPGPVSGNTEAGTLDPSATATLVVPTGWAGNVAVVDAQYPIGPDDSLVQGAYQVSSADGYAIADIAVSYVDGFSLPISCSCDDQVVTGCNIDLFSFCNGTNTCAQNDGQGACVNPQRTSTGNTPDSFFAACAGSAYTYPNDSGANSDGACQSDQITCCVGTACPANPKQDQTASSACPSS